MSNPAPLSLTKYIISDFAFFTPHFAFRILKLTCFVIDCPELYLCFRLLLCKLPGISEQVLEHYVQQSFVSFVDQVLLDEEFNFFFRMRPFQVSGDALSQCAQVYLSTMHLAPRNTGEAEEP